MEKITFCIDVDEVLRQTLSKMIEVYNRNFPDSQKKFEDIFDYKTEICFPEIEAATGMTASHWFFQKNSEELFLESEPFPNIKEDIEVLKKYGQVIILTYQKTYMNKRHTMEWLEKNGIEPDGICFLKDKTLIEADYFLDDNPWNFYDNKSKTGVLISAPYNLNENLHDLLYKSKCGDIIRCDSFHDFVMNYKKINDTIETTKKEYPIGKKFKLKKSVPYIDSTIYKEKRMFSHEGESVKFDNYYIEDMTPYGVIKLVDNWPSVSVKLNNVNLKDYLENVG